MARCKFIRDMWSPIYLVHAREDVIRYTFKNLIIYLVFLAITTSIILSMVPNLRFYFTQALKQQLTEKKFMPLNRNFISFHDIKSAAQFWSYFEEIVETTLYTEYWYGWHDRIANVTKDDKKILFENKLLGVPRLRQLRVRDNSCKIHEDFKNTFAGCYAGFTAYTEDKIPFGLEEETAWVYHEPSSMNITSFSHSGKVANYHAGGYYQDLGLTRNTTHDMLQNLKDNMWITRNTRVVFLDFTVYNGNINLFCIIKLIFEFPPTGGILTSSHFFPAYLIGYLTTTDFILLGGKLILICFLIYYTFIEINTIKHLKRKYFTFWWSYVEIIILLGFYVVCAFSIYIYFFIKTKIQSALMYPENYTSYELVGYLNSHCNNLLAVLLFIMWIKIFRFINLSRTMGQLNSTLSRCSGDILGFSLMFFIVFFAFAQMGYLLFGSQIEKFSTFGDSLLTLLMTILGEFDYYEIEATNKILAPIFFITYIFLVFFVLFNMFLAIITDTYSEVKEEINLKKSDLDFFDFIMRAPKNLFRKCKKTSKSPSEKKLPGNEMIRKIRRVLELCNFSDLEIQVFFSMYNINEKDDFDNDDIKRLLADVKRVNAEKLDGTSRPKHKAKNKVTMESYMKQQEKLENLDKQIQILKEKVDVIIKTSK